MNSGSSKNKSMSEWMPSSGASTVNEPASSVSAIGVIFWTGVSTACEASASLGQLHSNLYNQVTYTRNKNSDNLNSCLSALKHLKQLSISFRNWEGVMWDEGKIHCLVCWLHVGMLVHIRLALIPIQLPPHGLGKAEKEAPPFRSLPTCEKPERGSQLSALHWPSPGLLLPSAEWTSRWNLSLSLSFCIPFKHKIIP